MNKPSIPAGTRDFGPQEMTRRNYIFDTIKAVYALYGFMPIETPATEHLSTLTGKYGEEGDRLLFKILNSGDYLKKLSPEERESGTAAQLASKLCDRGLRYDLTVPFARYVVMHRNEITFPFKRYQIQPVWRADRPQKGRYREFYQCDADTIGTESLLAEVELVQIIDEVFKRLDIRTTLHLNNRKILAGIAEVLNCTDKLTDLTICMDKLDKIGPQGVAQQLKERGFTDDMVVKLQEILDLKGSNRDKLSHLLHMLSSSSIGTKGVEELEFILDHVETTPLQTSLQLDPSLARGLDYYTGAIFEVKAMDVPMGSITGGGRYDNLTGIFGLEGVSGVGISFGADRIYDVLDALDKFPKQGAQKKVLFINFGAQEVKQLLPFISQVRAAGIVAELYAESVKMKKQMSYADSLGFSHVVLAGSKELEAHSVAVKDMHTGKQENVSLEQLIDYLTH